MNVPLEIDFDRMNHSDLIKEQVREEAKCLEGVDSRITLVRVVIRRPQDRHGKGSETFTVRVGLAVTDCGYIEVSCYPASAPPEEDLHVAVREAFKSARFELQRLAMGDNEGFGLSVLASWAKNRQPAA